MLRYIYAKDLPQFPRLQTTMFRDRATQFKTRLGWDVRVNAMGEERDSYDGLNPLYVIWEMPDGRHGGSMRFLPTTGDTMVNDHFGHVFGNTKIVSPLIWECTRFCISPAASERVAAALTIGAADVMQAFHLRHFVAVFDPRMARLYRRLGVPPQIIGRAQNVAVGLWEMQPQMIASMLRKAGFDQSQAQQWFDLSFQTQDSGWQRARGVSSVSA